MNGSLVRIGIKLGETNDLRNFLIDFMKTCYLQTLYDLRVKISDEEDKLIKQINFSALQFDKKEEF